MHQRSSGPFEATARKTSVLVVDDFALVVEGLAATLAGDSQLEIVGLATDGASALRLARETRPDVVLIDPRLALGEVSVVDRLQAELPSIEAVLLTGADDHEPGFGDQPRQVAGTHARVGRSATRARLRATVIDAGRTPRLAGPRF